MEKGVPPSSTLNPDGFDGKPGSVNLKANLPCLQRDASGAQNPKCPKPRGNPQRLQSGGSGTQNRILLRERPVLPVSVLQNPRLLWSGESVGMLRPITVHPQVLPGLRNRLLHTIGLVLLAVPVETVVDGRDGNF